MSQKLQGVRTKNAHKIEVVKEKNEHVSNKKDREINGIVITLIYNENKNTQKEDHKVK